MMTEILPILSDTTPGVTRRAKLGSRFLYWRGQSDTRYLFTAVPFEALADFRSTVAILAEPAGDGRFLAWSAAMIDSVGRLQARDQSWPDVEMEGAVAFVHFLAETDTERHALVEDLFPEVAAPEFRLAA